MSPELHFFGLSVCRYGDKVPKANVSKTFAIVWILTGLVMMSILSGALTTAITIFVFEADIILYGTKVGLGNRMRSKTLTCQQLGTRALLGPTKLRTNIRRLELT